MDVGRLFVLIASRSSENISPDVQQQLDALQRQVSLTNRINSLSSVTLTAPTVGGGVTGLVASDIPTTITASNYLALTGGTLTGTLEVSTTTATSTIDGNLHVKGNLKIGTSSAYLSDAGLTSSNSFTISTNGEANTLALQSLGRVGVSSSTPWGVFSVEHNGANAGMPVMVVASSSEPNPYFLVDYLGRVGIGTSSPSDTFALNGAAYLADISAPSVSTNRLYSTSGSLYWAGNLISGASIGNWTSSSGNVYRASGNVGIGTSSPWKMLSVAGDIIGTNITATGTLSVSGASTFGQASTTLFSSYGPAYFGGTATSSFSSTGALTLATALTTGNGGTGTTTWQTNSIPYFDGTRLTENNANFNWNGTKLTATYASSSAVTSTNFYGTSLFLNGTNAVTNTGFGFIDFNKTSAGGVGVRFYTGGSNERVRIDSTGNVGIGTTTPSHTLTVANATAPQFSLVDTTAASNAWTLRSISNSFYLATSTYGATSTTAALAIDQNGNATFGNGLTITGASTHTGLATFTNGYVSQASSTVVGAFLSTGTTTAFHMAASDLGSAATPAFTFAPNATTGFFSPASNMLAWSTGGIEAMRIDASGNVGIGSTTPYALLSVGGNNGGYSGTTLFAIASTSGSTSNAYLTVDTNGFLVMGIGVGGTTTSSGTTLTFGNSGIFTIDASSSTTTISNLSIGNLVFDTNAGVVNLADLPVDRNAAAGVQQAYSFSIAGTSTLTVSGMADGNGNVVNFGVAIGASASPYAMLHVTGADTAATTKAFLVANSASTTLFSITDAGNVGIGTTAPSNKLSVNGGADITGNLGVGGTTTPYALLSLIATSTTGAGSPTTLFAIASTTGGTATTTLFSVNNMGLASTTALEVSNSTTLDAVKNCNGASNALGTDVNGVVQCDAGVSDARLKTNVTALDSSMGLALIEKLTPVAYNWKDPNVYGATGAVQYGFVAQDALATAPTLVGTSSLKTALTPDQTYFFNYQGLAAPIVRAIQEIVSIAGAFKDALIAWLGDAGNGITDFFAQRGHFADQLCVGDTCVTPAQFQAMVAAANQSGSSGSGNSASSANSSQAISSPDTTPPVIEIDGNNPATINVGDTYSDLGATITAPEQDKNLGIHTYVGTTPIEQAVIDTSAPATYHIYYVATDASGNTATSTRTVIVEAPVQTQVASSTDETTATASVVQGSSTEQANATTSTDSTTASTTSSQ